jgi:hypothetical protein
VIAERPELNDEDAPIPRGGHFSVFVDGIGIYVFGGWDGTKDIGDMWLYDIRVLKWKRLSGSTFHEVCSGGGPVCGRTRFCRGPQARSCHKMAYDSKNKRIYLLGCVDKDMERN